MEQYVDSKLCDERNGNLVKRVDKHSEEIDDLKAAVIKLTQLVELHEKKINAEDIKSETSKFWQSDTGKALIKTFCIIAIILTMAAIGMNYFKEYLDVMAK